jgi:hypothetical protein
MKKVKGLLLPAVVLSAVTALGATASPAHATTVGCQEGIARASSIFVQARSRALTVCEQRKLRGKLPRASDCLSDSKTILTLEKATSSLRTAIAKSCGGSDKTCGSGIDDDSPTSIGFPSTCPNLGGANCNMPIDDCGDVASCVACIGGSAAGDASNLYYGKLLPTSDKHVGMCQRTIGAATVKFLQEKSKALQTCWNQRLKGKHNDMCPNPEADPKSPSGKAAVTIARAEAKKVKAICNACGGADKVCGTADDLAPATIGFAELCPFVKVPGGEDCNAIGRINTLEKLVQCVDCVTEFNVDCADSAAVPEFVPYPRECTGVAECTATIATDFSPRPPDDPVAGVLIKLGYPGREIDIPGFGNDPSVLSRVTNLTGLDGIFSAGDNDTDLDGIDDTLAVGLIDLSSPIPSGNFASAQFDCRPPQVPSLTDFTCTADLSTANGKPVDGTCSVVSLAVTP